MNISLTDDNFVRSIREPNSDSIMTYKYDKIVKFKIDKNIVGVRGLIVKLIDTDENLERLLKKEN